MWVFQQALFSHQNEIDKYFSIFQKLQEAMQVFVTDNQFTRRCISQFDKEHCFQNIQFLVRNNKLVIICNMRSCNVIENYENDILICSLLADEFKQVFKKMYPSAVS